MDNYLLVDWSPPMPPKEREIVDVVGRAVWRHIHEQIAWAAFMQAWAENCDRAFYEQCTGEPCPS